MSDKDSLRQAILEEEARLVRIEKERAEALARLKELKNRLAAENSASNRHGRRPSGATYPTKDQFSSRWLTVSDRIRAASEIPFEVDLVEKSPSPTSRKNSRRK